MSIFDELADVATAIADRHVHELEAAEIEYAKLETELLAAKTRVDSLRSLPERQTAFNKRLANAEPACPVCWFQYGVWSAVRDIGGAGDDDRFRCSRCRTEFRTPG